MANRKIDLIIVGAQKAGTTSLLRYLGEHPDIVAHPQKEFAYFWSPEEYNHDYNHAYQKYYPAGEIALHKKLIAKSAGLYANENALKNLYEHNPGCKLVIILRNPVERAYSSYLMEKNYDSVKFQFSELEELIKEHDGNDESWGFSFLIRFGLYASCLKTIYKYFPQDQVKIILYEDLKNNSALVCKQLYDFAGVNSDFTPNTEVRHNVTVKTHSTFYARILNSILYRKNMFKRLAKRLIRSNRAYKYGDFLRNMNKTTNKHEEMDPKARRFLIEYYREHNLELEKIIGKDLSEWNS